VSERLLTAREVAELLGLSMETVLKRFEKGDLPGFRLYGRKGAPVRFRWSELEAALEGWRLQEAAVPGRGERQLTPAGTADGPYDLRVRSRSPANPVATRDRRDEED
jgi:excisionase family DNA binding protein